MNKKLYVVLFMVGIGLGIFFGIQKLGASVPTNSANGEQPASVHYDEYWQATNSLVSTAAGLEEFNPSTRNQTKIAAKLSGSGPTVDFFPKMVVTRWKVHGHIHFQ